MLVLTASTLSSCHVTDIFASSETHVPKKSTHYNIFSVQMGLFFFLQMTLMRLLKKDTKVMNFKIQ